MAATHSTPHPDADKTVKLAELDEKGKPKLLVVEDWTDRIGRLDALAGALQSYGIRARLTDLPNDGQLVMGTVDGLEQVVHVTEIL